MSAGFLCVLIPAAAAAHLIRSARRGAARAAYSYIWMHISAWLCSWRGTETAVEGGHGRQQ